MKALRYHGRRDFRIDDVPKPAIRSGTVMVDVEWSGICGSELHEYLEGPISVPAESPNPVTGERVPVILGHEFAGTVSAVADDVDDVDVGDRVAVEPLVYCRRCDACLTGDYHLCQELAIIGIHGVAGGFSKHAVVPSYAVHKLPANVSTELGALVEPLAVAWHGMRQARLRTGQSVLVVGGGPIGLATLLCAQAAGASWTGVSVRRAGARRDAAVRLGADAVLDASSVDVAAEVQQLTGGHGADVVFETAGTQEAMDTALESVRVGGTIVSLAVWAAPGRCDYMRLLLKEITLVGSMCYSNDFPAVIEALGDGRIRGAEEMITKRVDLEHAVVAGFDALVTGKGEHVKVLVRP